MSAMESPTGLSRQAAARILLCKLEPAYSCTWELVRMMYDRQTTVEEEESFREAADVPVLLDAVEEELGGEARAVAAETIAWLGEYVPPGPDGREPSCDFGTAFNFQLRVPLTHYLRRSADGGWPASSYEDVWREETWDEEVPTAVRWLYHEYRRDQTKARVRVIGHNNDLTIIGGRHFLGIKALCRVCGVPLAEIRD